MFDMVLKTPPLVAVFVKQIFTTPTRIKTNTKNKILKPPLKIDVLAIAYPLAFEKKQQELILLTPFSSDNIKASATCFNLTTQFFYENQARRVFKFILISTHFMPLISSYNP